MRRCVRSVESSGERNGARKLLTLPHLRQWVGTLCPVDGGREWDAVAAEPLPASASAHPCDSANRFTTGRSTTLTTAYSATATATTTTVSDHSALNREAA